MCSLSRSISTSPGMSRSPVNSAKVTLQWALREYAPVDFHAAGQVHVAVDLGLGAAHLQRDRVVDPIAHLVAHQRPIGNRRGKREGCRIQFRQLQVEIKSEESR